MKTVIVEDEKRSQAVIQNLLELSCPEIEIIGMADSIISARNLINDLLPDLVFLDIQLSDGTGFDLLESLRHLSFHVIFTTAFDQYAIKAFQFSAVDYLLKPLDIDEVKKAVQKCIRLGTKNITDDQLRSLLNNLKLKSDEQPILTVSTTDRIEFVKISDIIRCEASAAYTTLHLKHANKIIISKVIKEMEILLSDFSFQRIHQSHLVNLHEINKYWKKMNVLEMSDGSRLPISRSRKEGFFRAISGLRI